MSQPTYPIPANLPVTPVPPPRPVQQAMDTLRNSNLRPYEAVGFFMQWLAELDARSDEIEYSGRSGVDSYSFKDYDEIDNPQWSFVTFGDDDFREEF